mgnify:CR=1 FL=1
MAELYLDSQEARKRVRAGDADAPAVKAIPDPINVSQASIPKPKSFEDFGYSLSTNLQSPGATSTQKPKSFEDYGYTTQIKSKSFEDYGFQVDPSFAAAPPAQAIEPVAQKPKTEGFFTGIGKSIAGGVQDTAGSLFSAGATAIDARDAVVDSAKSAAARSPDQALALQQFSQDIKKRQAEDDTGLMAGIKNVAGATYDNPEGAFQMVVSQLPNTVVSLGAGAAGALAGSAFGPIGTVAGFVTGLFSANTALEIGGKAQKAAADGNFTDAERYEVIKQGVVKGGVITAVDVATLGA